MDMTVAQIAALVGGRVMGEGETVITGVSGVREAAPGDLTFIRAARYAEFLGASNASAVLIAEPVPECTIAQILVAQPELAFAKVLQHFELQQTRHPRGIHPTAVVGEGVTLGTEVSLDAHVRIADDCVIGAGSVVYAGAYIGRGCRIGTHCVIHPNAVLREETQLGDRCIVHAGATIGSDGFGFAPMGGRWVKIPQIGRVVVGDDVEIGSGTAIDRATFGVTRIGDGTKIDNLVQIGHNVEIGKHCAIAGMVGIAGSAIIKDNVRIGAGAGITGHITVGEGAIIAGWAGVTKSIEAGKLVSGFPAQDHNDERRVVAAQQRGPEVLRRVKQLERQLQMLETKLNEQTKNNS